jgi:hypothetical protein
MADRGIPFPLPPSVSFPLLLNGSNDKLNTECFEPDHFKAKWTKDGKALPEVGIWGRNVLVDGTVGIKPLDYNWKSPARDGGVDLAEVPREIAEAIRAYAADNSLSIRWSQRASSGEPFGFPLDDPDDPEGGTREGRLLVRKHYSRERDPKARRKKIKEHIDENGRLFCTICGFDFHETYGPHGIDFIECHHIVPLSLSGERKTYPEDLILICANCHRMIHHKKPRLWPHQLRDKLIQMNRSAAANGYDTSLVLDQHPGADVELSLNFTPSHSDKGVLVKRVRDPVYPRINPPVALQVNRESGVWIVEHLPEGAA